MAHEEPRIGAADLPPPSAGEGGPRSGSGEGNPASGERTTPDTGPTRLNAVAPRLRTFARGQRRAMPNAEALFWQQVRNGRFRGLKFKRQVPITPYIVDFLCVSARLIVELDGPPHETEARRQRDAERDAWLRGQGFTVLRFPNEQILGNLGAVLDEVGSAIDARRADGQGPAYSGSVAPLSRPLLTQGPPSPAEGGGKVRVSC